MAVGYPFRVQKEGLKLRKRASYAEIGFNGAYRMKLGSESMKFRRESTKRQADLEHARVVSVRWSMDSYRCFDLRQGNQDLCWPRERR